jgi:hypothetical protein
MVPIYDKDIVLLERVQRTYTRRVFARCSIPPCPYEDRLKIMGLVKLDVRRLFMDLTLTYKIINNMIDLPIDDFFERREININNENDSKVFLKFLSSTTKNNTQSNTLAHRVYKHWNGLPQSITSAVSLAAFKSRLKLYMFI